MSAKPGEDQTYAQALAQYHLHPEGKFLNGRYLDYGTTLRRHVHTIGFAHIGKEANRWEEQYFLGAIDEAEVDYGTAPDSTTGLMTELNGAARAFGLRRLATKLDVSRNTLSSWLTQGLSKGASSQARGLQHNLSRLRAERERDDEEQASRRSQLAEDVRCDGLSHVADRLGIDPSNLRKYLNGRRRWPRDRPNSDERQTRQDRHEEQESARPIPVCSGRRRLSR